MCWTAAASCRRKRHETALKVTLRCRLGCRWHRSRPVHGAGVQRCAPAQEEHLCRCAPVPRRGEVMAESEPRGGRVTLKSVAQKAGVSLATASKVMNGRADVRESTRQAVAEAARDLGYQPKRRDLDRSRSALIHFQTLTCPYSLQVLEESEQAVQRGGVDQRVISSDQTMADLPRSRLVDAAVRGVEGVILVSTPFSSQH